MSGQLAAGPASSSNLAYAAPTLSYERGVELQPARPAELLAHLSGAFDLAESQSPGHAARVAYLALVVAEQLGIGALQRGDILLAGLLHDSGIAIRGLPEDIDATGGHTAAGAWVASRFDLDDVVQHTIRCSHERWDGDGRPAGLAESDVPLESRLVSAAHWASDLVQDLDNPLRARARMQGEDMGEVAAFAGPEVSESLEAVLRDDHTWLALWDARLPQLIVEQAGPTGKPSLRAVEHVANAMGEVVDAAARESGRSHRVSALAVELARLTGAPDSECRAIGVAGHLLDIGLLGVPRYVTEKPAILSVSEMDVMRHHPSWSARILETMPGMEDIAQWVEFHHERPDGRGYPEMLEGDELPLASRILAVADSYCALRAERPYRAAFSPDEAAATLGENAGSQYDPQVVDLLPEALLARDPAS